MSNVASDSSEVYPRPNSCTYKPCRILDIPPKYPCSSSRYILAPVHRLAEHPSRQFGSSTNSDTQEQPGFFLHHPGGPQKMVLVCLVGQWCFPAPTRPLKNWMIPDKRSLFHDPTRRGAIQWEVGRWVYKLNNPSGKQESICIHHLR